MLINNSTPPPCHVMMTPRKNRHSSVRICGINQTNYHAEFLLLPVITIPQSLVRIMHRMIFSPSVPSLLSQVSRRYASNESKEGFRRFMQTITDTSATPLVQPWSASAFPGRVSSQNDTEPPLSRWASHKLAVPVEPVKQPVRRSRAHKFKRLSKESAPEISISNLNASTSPAGQGEMSSEGLLIIPIESSLEEPSIEATTGAQASVVSTASTTTTTTTRASTTTTPTPKKRRQLRPRKALITLSKSAVQHLQQLLALPEPKFIRIGVRNRGCSGLTYHLEYVTEAGKFDERIDQDGVTVLIDSKALFSIVGSEMDWLDDKLSSRFVFKNPNSKGTCGCGESFMV